MTAIHSPKRLLRGVLSAAAIAAAVCSFSGPVAAQSTPVSYFMVLQDFSDCTNGNVNPNPPSTMGGFGYATRNTDGTTSVNLGLTARPNTTYHFFLKCVTLIQDITTDDEGEANVQMTFPTNSVGNTFAFDMYPEGAPLGNKYQSTTITMP